MFTISQDVHQHFFAVCILDINGKRVKELQVRGRRLGVTIFRGEANLLEYRRLR